MWNRIYTLSQTLRFNEWWSSKIPLFLGLFLLAINPALTLNHIVQDLARLFLWLFSAAAFGYFLNDCFDIEEDVKSGKGNYARFISPPLRAVILLTLSLFAVLPWLLTGRTFIATLATLHILTFVFYSVPPIRLKDRLYLGIIADSLYAFTLPTMLTLALAIDVSGLQSQLFIAGALWSVFAGFRAIILHHVNDRKNDKNISKGNVVNRYGIKINLFLFNLLLIPEAFFFLSFYFINGYFFFKVAAISIYSVLQFFIITRTGLNFSIKRNVITGQIRFFEFYERWLLLVVSITLVKRDWRFIFLFLVAMALFRLVAYYYIYHRVLVRGYYFLMHLIYHVIILNVFFFIQRLLALIFYHILLPIYFWIKYKVLIPSFNFFIFHVLRPPGSLVVNYSIYGYRRVILRLTDTEARLLVTEISPFTDFFKRSPSNNSKTNPVFSAAGVGYNGTTKSLKITTDILNKNDLTDENKRVNGLWIGEELSKIELLTIESFIRNGHDFHLWTYGPLKTKLPEKVILEDANEIIPASKIFRYKYPNSFGHGKGSVSGFSDVFRYKLIYEKGGWWVDMDITCLRPLNVIPPYFFRQHHDLQLVGNLMKCPAGSELMKRCYSEAVATIDENNRDWHKPIEILNRHVFELGLQDYIFGGMSNEDKWDEVKTYVKGKQSLSAKYLVVHWMNEEWRSRGMDKSDFRFRSTLGEEMLRYSLIRIPEKRRDLYVNEFRHLFWLPVYQMFRR